MKIDYTVQVWREGGQFIAHAMPLDVASSGPSVEAAREAADEAVRLFIATATMRGTLEEVLEETGYHREEEGWRSPDCLGSEQRAWQKFKCPSSRLSIGGRWRRFSSLQAFNLPDRKAVIVRI